MKNTTRELPLPPHYDAETLDRVWRVPYQERAQEAREWSEKYGIQPAGDDEQTVALILIDVQNTFCLPDFELFVAGRSGMGAVEDNRRLTAFMYRNLGEITHITATMDTHRPLQIFHALFLVDDEGNHPPANTMITSDEVKAGKWQVNPAAVASLGVEQEYADRFLRHYTKRLAEKEKYDLTIWPYHAMLGGIGHALVSGMEEAIFFHSIARHTQADYLIKGEQIFTEHYSAVGPEVFIDPDGEKIAHKDEDLLGIVRTYDRIVIAGQAKSHCVAWTVSDLIKQIKEEDPTLADKIYLLEDCTSPVVIPDVVDFTDQADRAYERFSQEGLRIVRSTDPISTW
jgi:nicotinamidase-related amidase